MDEYNQYFNEEMNSLEIWGIYTELVKKIGLQNHDEVKKIEAVYNKFYSTAKKRERSRDINIMTSY